MTYRQNLGVRVNTSEFKQPGYQHPENLMALTDTFSKNVNAGELATGQKHTDGKGMFLHVKPIGKYWRVSYRFGSKQKTLALGLCPAVSLAKAPQRRTQARTLVAEGIGPQHRQKSAQTSESRRSSAPLKTGGP